MQLGTYSQKTRATVMRGSSWLHIPESRLPIWQSCTGLAAKNVSRFWRSVQHHFCHLLESCGGRVNSGRMALMQHKTRLIKAPKSCVLESTAGAGTLQTSKEYPSQTAVGSH